MGQMHELLAAETSTTANYNRDMRETLHVFGKPEAFTRIVTTKKHFSEDDAKLDTKEVKEITTTVKDRLDWFKNQAGPFFDIQVSKDATNQKAVADVEIDGKVVLTGIPATTLLMMETKLQDLRAVLEAIPTLDTSIEWEFNAAQGLWKNQNPQVTFSTKKKMSAVVLYEATDKHPAQVKEVSDDIPIAKITRDTLSGMVTSGQKAEYLNRLDSLLKAVKIARQKANQTKVEDRKIGSAIFNYLLGG